MNSVVKSALILVAIVAVLSLGFTFSGFQLSSPILSGLIFIVVAILANAGCLFWGLSGTAVESGYLKQLLNSAIFGLLAGLLIFGFSLLMLTVLAPDHLAEVKLAAIEALEGMNMPEQARTQQIDALEARTAMGEARGGLIGTFVTSLIFGAIISIFKRKK